MSSPSDEALIRRVVKRDDRHAFATLVRRHQSDLRNSLTRLCGGDRALADDLSQEVFIKVYLYLPGFKHKSSFKTWLYRISWNSFYSERQKSAHDFLEAAVAIELDEIPGSNTQEAEQAHRQRDIQWAMAQLSAVQQIMVDLNLVRGFSHKEIVEITGVPLGTVKSHILRARQKLQVLLVEHVLPG